MNFFGLSFPMGRFAGIEVRVHFTFFLYAFSLLWGHNNVLFGAILILGLYLSILLHEFGHALAARWCDGDARQIVLWPLGGLAMVRPLFNPTAHLITAAAGPMVSLVLFAGFTLLTHLLPSAFWMQWPILYGLTSELAQLNGMLLFFNLIPAFPMDGGRILRDTLWHWIGVERATNTAVFLSRVLAGVGIAAGIFFQAYQLSILALFIFLLCSAEQNALLWEGPVMPFSIRERLKRGRRQRAFFGAVARAEQAPIVEGFHRCAVCGRTEIESPEEIFRVSSDGHEYCARHLPARAGR